MIDTKGKTINQVAEEVFSRLVKQGGRCLDGGGRACCYGDGTGNHCAIGWLLPEHLMDAGAGVRELFDSEELGPNHDFIGEHLTILKDMQILHDTDSAGVRGVTREKLMEAGVESESIDTWVEMGLAGAGSGYPE